MSVQRYSSLGCATLLIEKGPPPQRPVPSHPGRMNRVNAAGGHLLSCRGRATMRGCAVGLARRCVRDWGGYMLRGWIEPDAFDPPG